MKRLIIAMILPIGAHAQSPEINCWTFDSRMKSMYGVEVQRLCLELREAKEEVASLESWIDHFRVTVRELKDRLIENGIDYKPEGK